MPKRLWYMPKRLWYMLHEPRVITATMSGAWVLVSLIGFTAFMEPPITISHVIGPFLTTLWASFFLVGGVLGLVGCMPGWWWVERLGIIATSTGTIIYLVVVISLHTSTAGSRLTQAGFILLGLFFMANRWLRIWGSQLDPSRGMTR